MRFAEPHAEVGGSAAAARSGRLLSGAGGNSLHPQSSDVVAGGICEGRRADDGAELGDFYGDGSARICGTRPRHQCRRRSDAGHEHSAGRTRPGSDGGSAGCGTMGRRERSSPSPWASCFGYLTICVRVRSSRARAAACGWLRPVPCWRTREARRSGSSRRRCCSFIRKIGFADACLRRTWAWGVLRSRSRRTWRAVSLTLESPRVRSRPAPDC